MFERFTQQARQSVIAAQEEARALTAPRILPAHVLLGTVSTAASSGGPLHDVLAAAGLTPEQLRRDLRDAGTHPDDAEALESVGIDLDAVRAAVEAQFGPGALDTPAPAPRRGFFGSRKGSHIAFTAGARSVLENSLREATARKDGYIGAEHLLLGLLRGGDPTVQSLIRRHIAPEELAARIRLSLDAAA